MDALPSCGPLKKPLPQILSWLRFLARPPTLPTQQLAAERTLMAASSAGLLRRSSAGIVDLTVRIALYSAWKARTGLQEGRAGRRAEAVRPVIDAAEPLVVGGAAGRGPGRLGS